MERKSRNERVDLLYFAACRYGKTRMACVMKKLIIIFAVITLIFASCVPPEQPSPIEETGLLNGGGFAVSETPTTAPTQTQALTQAQIQTTVQATVQATAQTTPSPSPPAYTPLNHDEVTGVWISYIELAGILTGKTGAQFRASYAKMMDNCLTLGINTVYVHLRPFGDALYQSDYYPWSQFVTGTLGQAPDFDPLAVMLEESHKRGISFHGWINPMRIQSERNISRVSRDYAIGQWYTDDSKRGRYIVQHGNNWFLNPAYPEVIELIGNGAREITAKYNVDGIHIDDYFYPTTSTSFDAHAFNASSFTTLSNFRIFNCNKMVSTLFTAVKQGNPDALFGVSPQGNIEGNLTHLYADVETWCRNPGYADYIAPQFYYGFHNETQPYIECINKWQAFLENSDVVLIFGLAVYKVGAEDAWAGTGSREWLEEKQILRRQIAEARKLASYGGIILYSYNYLFNPVHVTAAIRDEIEAFKPLLR
jgi:uncharacterized lipoprotein YddW (UPF0748 family)